MHMDVKVYVTANILAHNHDLEGVREYFEELKEIGAGCTDHCRSGNVYDMQRKYVRRSNVTSVHRQTIPIMRHIVSGITWVQSVW